MSSVFLTYAFDFPREIDTIEGDERLVNSAVVRVTPNGSLLVTCFVAGSTEPLYMNAHTSRIVMWYIKRHSITRNMPLDRKRFWTLCRKSCSQCSQFKYLNSISLIQVLHFFCFCYITNQCTIYTITVHTTTISVCHLHCYIFRHFLSSSDSLQPMPCQVTNVLLS